MADLNSYKEFTDLELIALLQKDDQVAFTEIYQRYWKKLFAVAVNKLQDPEEAREIVQNIFISLWDRRNSLAIKSTLHVYLAVSVKYRVINFLDKLNTKNSYLNELHKVDSDNSTQDWLDFIELKEQPAVLVSELPEKCRLVFTLSREEGYTQREIAEKLNISEKTVEGHLTKAIKNLKNGLNNFVLTLL